MKQRYSISFDDIRGRRVDVAVYGRDWTGGVTELTGGASPLTLDEDDAEGIDTPCRAWTGSLTVMTEDGVDYSGLYAADVTDVRVEVRREGSLVWQGYVSPEVMRQSWVAGDELTVSVQSPLAALSGLTLDASAGFGFSTLGGLLAEALALTGDWDTVTFPADLSVPGRTGLDAWLNLTVSRMAFFSREYDESEWDEGDVARIVYQGATGREVVEAVARLTGWTARERGRTLWLTAESVSAYITVAAGELGTAGRATTVVAAPTVVLDGLRPAGTDHTVSQLRGYRRVRVTFDAGVPDDLLPGNDIHNWVPREEYEFRENQPFQKRDAPEESAGYYVFCGSDYTAGRGADYSVGVRYIIANYEAISLDGMSRTYLYGLYHADGDADYAGWSIGDYPTYGGEPVIPDDRWSLVTSAYPGYDRLSFAGGWRSWLRWRRASVDSSSDVDYVYAYDFREMTRDNGYLLFMAANKDAPVAALSEQRVPLLTLRSAETYLLTDCALLLAGNFSGFYALSDPYPIRSFSGTYVGKIGPWAVTKNDGITSWPMRLRVGRRYWNGLYWQEEECTFTVNLTGDDNTDSATIEPTGREDDADKYGNDDGYIAPLTDAEGDPVVLIGDVELTLLFPDLGTVADSTPRHNQMAWFNPVLVRDLSLTVLHARTSETAYEDEGADPSQRTYIAQTGYRGAEDVYEVEERLGTWDNDGCAVNVLVDGTAPLEALTSARQGGRTARPERLVLGVLQRLYGRARQQLSVEVEAAELWPSVTVMDGATRYALTGVHWDVREARATYVLEDFVPFDEWRAGR